jgi:hypothetical protein
MKTDKQKAKEILRKRRLAAEGLKETPKGANALEDPAEQKDDELADEALTIDLGLRR